MKTTMSKMVHLNIKGFKGKASTLLQLFGDVAIKEGWSEKEINAVKTEAMRPMDYDHCIETIREHCKE